MGRVYLFVVVWIVGLVALFGPLLYVDNLMQNNGGWPETRETAPQNDQFVAPPVDDAD